MAKIRVKCFLQNYFRFLILKEFFMPQSAMGISFLFNLTAGPVNDMPVNHIQTVHQFR